MTKRECIVDKEGKKVPGLPRPSARRTAQGGSYLLSTAGPRAHNLSLFLIAARPLRIHTQTVRACHTVRRPGQAPVKVHETTPRAHRQQATSSHTKPACQIPTPSSIHPLQSSPPPRQAQTSSEHTRPHATVSTKRRQLLCRQTGTRTTTTHRHIRKKSRNSKHCTHPPTHSAG